MKSSHWAFEKHSQMKELYGHNFFPSKDVQHYAWMEDKCPSYIPIARWQKTVEDTEYECWALNEGEIRKPIVLIRVLSFRGWTEYCPKVEDPRVEAIDVPQYFGSRFFGLYNFFVVMDRVAPVGGYIHRFKNFIEAIRETNRILDSLVVDKSHVRTTEGNLAVLDNK